MTSQTLTLNWSAINADPPFQALHRKKSRFLLSLFLFSVVFYFALPVGAAYFTDIFKIKVWGPLNVGLIFALLEFVVAWGIAFIYARKASEFDAIAEEINRKALKRDMQS